MKWKKTYPSLLLLSACRCVNDELHSSLGGLIAHSWVWSGFVWLNLSIVQLDMCYVHMYHCWVVHFLDGLYASLLEGSYCRWGYTWKEGRKWTTMKVMVHFHEIYSSLHVKRHEGVEFSFLASVGPQGGSWLVIVVCYSAIVLAFLFIAMDLH